MRLDQHVGHHDLALEVRPLTLVARILVRADIVPGPAVEAAVAHPRDVVRRQVVTERIALVGRAPQVSAAGLHRKPDTVADARREYPAVLALRIEYQHVGTVGF